MPLSVSFLLVSLFLESTGDGGRESSQPLYNDFGQIYILRKQRYTVKKGYRSPIPRLAGKIYNLFHSVVGDSQ